VKKYTIAAIAVLGMALSIPVHAEDARCLVNVYKSNETGYENRINAFPYIKEGDLWYFGDLSAYSSSKEPTVMDRYSGLSMLGTTAWHGFSARYQSEVYDTKATIEVKGKPKLKETYWRDNRNGVAYVGETKPFDGKLWVWNEAMVFKCDHVDYRYEYTVRARYDRFWLDNQYYYDTTEGKKVNYRDRLIFAYDLSKRFNVQWRSEWKSHTRINYVGGGIRF